MERLTVCAIAALIILPPSVCYALDGPARVVDGDTLVIDHQRIRIQNFNAPEMNEPGGPEARAKMQALTSGHIVHCDPKARDKYARIVARCSVDGVDLGKAMRR